MKVHKIHTEEKRLEVLNELLGKEVYIVSAPHLYISTSENVMTSSYFLMNFFSKNKLGLRQLKTFKFRCKLFDENDVDFYKIYFAIKKLEKKLEDMHDSFVFNDLNATISFAPTSKIVKIQVLNYNHVFKSENPDMEDVEVDYDDGLLFFQENGKRFLFSCLHSISEESQFIRDDIAIDKRIKGLNVRTEIKL